MGHPHQFTGGYGCFHATVAELCKCNREHLLHKACAIYYLALYRKELLTPVLEN